MPLTPRQELTQLLERVGESRALYELGVHRTTLMRWRTGRVEIPQAVFYVLRDLAYGAGVDPDWEGWIFRDGKLHSPSRDVFTPGDLMALRYMRDQINALERERREMQAKIDAMAQDPSVRGASANDAAIAYVPAA